jgi:malonyl-CoA/methylmalonyl-CoA synthetase
MSPSQLTALGLTFDERAQATAVIDGARSWSYGDLRTAAASRAQALSKRGVVCGDRVASLLSPSMEAIAWNLACYATGAVFVPVNTRYQSAEIRHIVEDCAPRVMLHEPASTPTLHAVRDAIDGDVDLLNTHDAWTPSSEPPTAGLNLPSDDRALALLIYTSGTTGRSKGVMLEHGAVLGNMRALTDAWGFHPNDQLVLALPLFHVHGLCIGVHGGLLQGLTLRLVPKFSPAAVADSLRAGGTVFMGVPTMYSRIVDHLSAHPEDVDPFRAARLFTSGSAALSPQVFSAFEALTGHRILERYGMSETLITLSNPLEAERRPGTVGRPVPGVDVRVRDDQGTIITSDSPGELEVRSNGMMRGYWGRDAPSNPWFATGDIVTRATDGYLSIVGRKSVDIIKSGGFKIAAREIEEVLRDHPDVEEVGVVGVTHPEWGEEIVAFVEGASRPETRDALEHHCKAALAHYKCPRHFWFVDALPRNALGKLQKHLLKREHTRLLTGA